MPHKLLLRYSARPFAIAIAAACSCMLASCALNPPPARVAVTTPASWLAPTPEQLPHDGLPGELNRWWSQLGDEALLRLIVASQDASPTLASARTRVVQARANRIAAQAALGPSVNGTASASAVSINRSKR